MALPARRVDLEQRPVRDVDQPEFPVARREAVGEADITDRDDRVERVTGGRHPRYRAGAGSRRVGPVGECHDDRDPHDQRECQRGDREGDP